MVQRMNPESLYNIHTYQSRLYDVDTGSADMDIHFQKPLAYADVFTTANSVQLEHLLAAFRIKGEPLSLTLAGDKIAVMCHYPL